MNRLLVLIRTIAVLAVVAIVTGLFAQASYGSLTILDLFWEGIVPLVPIWLLVSPQTWRQVCPVATVNLSIPSLPHRRRQPLAAKLPAKAAHWLRRYGLIVAAVILWVVVPMRLVLFNSSATATGMLILSIVAIAGMMGFLMPWKSGWCATICPVYPVEKLYGAAPPITIHDKRCATLAGSKSCFRCSLNCADIPASDVNYWNAMQNVPAKNSVHAIRNFFIGSFPGFVLGYVLIWAYAHITKPTLSDILFVYAVILAMMLVSFSLYRFFTSKATTGSSARSTVIALLIALNIYYIVGANGIATVVSKIAGREDLVLSFMFPILGLVFVSSFIWLIRVWRRPLESYIQW